MCDQPIETQGMCRFHLEEKLAHHEGDAAHHAMKARALRRFLGHEKPPSPIPFEAMVDRVCTTAMVCTVIMRSEPYGGISAAQTVKNIREILGWKERK